MKRDYRAKSTRDNGVKTGAIIERANINFVLNGK